MSATEVSFIVNTLDEVDVNLTATLPCDVSNVGTPVANLINFGWFATAALVGFLLLPLWSYHVTTNISQGL